MIYCDVKNRLLSFFEPEKLEVPGEWGFLNELDRDVQKIGYATNLTPETVAEAAGHGVDMMLTHHDAWGFIYGMKDACLALLEKHGITHAFFHAPLDDADFGTNASLAGALKLRDCRQAIPYQPYMAGIIGELRQPVGFEQFEAELSGILGEPLKAFKNNDREIRRVCVATGGGNMTQDMKCAVDGGCDAYVTGEYVLYSQQYARFAGMDLFIGSHTNTEILGIGSLAEKLAADTGMTVVRLFEENF